MAIQPIGKPAGKPLVLKSIGSSLAPTGTALIFGPAGSGKTSLIRTLAPLLPKTADGKPDWTKVLLVVADPGYASILDLEGINVCTLWQDMLPNELLSALYSPENANKFSFIIVDGLDSFGQRVHTALDDAERAKPKPDGFEVWREFAKATRTWIKGMRDVPNANVIFISHDQEFEEGIRFRPSWVGGATRRELLGFFDYVFYMKTVPPTDPAVKGKTWPAVFYTNQNMATGGSPQHEVKCRVRADRPQLPGKMHADLAVVWNTLFKVSPTQ